MVSPLTVLVVVPLCSPQVLSPLPSYANRVVKLHSDSTDSWSLPGPGRAAAHAGHRRRHFLLPLGTCPRNYGTSIVP